MKKTSRRNFAKLITGAAVAIPAAKLAAQVRPTKHQEGLQQILHHENTPPPIGIEDGSFQLKIKYTGETPPLRESGSGMGWTYRGNVNGDLKNEFSHIRILHGSGEHMYSDVNAKGSKILIELKDQVHDLSGRLVFEDSASELIVTSNGVGNSNGNGRLTHSSNPGYPRNKHKWGHKGGNNPNRDFRISHLTVTKLNGSVVAFDEDFDTANFESQELRILIWLSPERQTRA